MIGLVNRSRTVITVMSLMSLMSVLALGACSGSDPKPKLADPSPSSSAPSSPSTTAVSGPIEPTMPAAARGTDAAAAEAFVKFYWEMADYAQATGDLDGLRALGTDACRACQTVLDYLAGIYDHGGSVTGGETTVTGTVATGVDGGPGASYAVRGTVANTRQVIDDPRKRKEQVFPAARVRFQFIAEHRVGGWQIAFWETRS